MTTYTVTTTNNIDFSYTYDNQTAKEVKSIKARFSNNKAMKVIVTKNIKCYYRGEAVEIIEERTMGWTLVVAAGKPEFLAVTKELEYK